MKKISVIIPCYNAEKYLRRCMDSLTGQTIGIDQMELIVINDASTDCTLDLLLEYEKAYPESVLVINNEQNGRQGYCRNLGYTYASGEYIGYMDDDDWADKTMFEKLYLAAKAEDCEMAECDSLRTGMEQNETPEPLPTEYCSITTNEEREKFLANNMQKMCIWNRIYKKSFMDRIQVSFPVGTFYEDEYFTTLILSYINKYCLVHETLHFYFTHPEATSEQGTAGKKEFDGMIVEPAILQELKSRGLYEGCREYYDFRFLQKYYVEGLIRVFRKLPEITDEALIKTAIMQKTVLMMYPNFENNAYLRIPELETQRMILNSVYEKFDRASLEEFRKKTLQEFEKHREKIG